MLVVFWGRTITYSNLLWSYQWDEDIGLTEMTLFGRRQRLDRIISSINAQSLLHRIDKSRCIRLSASLIGMNGSGVVHMSVNSGLCRSLLFSTF